MRDRLIKRQSYNQRNKKSFSSSFRAPKKENKGKTIFIFCLIGLFIIALAITYLVFFSNFFKIKDIEVSGSNSRNEVVKSMVEEQVNGNSGLFSQKNIIIFNKARLLNNLSEFNFSSISVNKNIWKRHLILKINEREEALLYLEAEKYYFLDNAANVIKSNDACTASTTENCLKIDDNFRKENFLPIIENHSDMARISEDQKYAKIDEEYLNFSFKLYNDLNDSSEFGFKKINLDGEYNTIKVQLNNNLELYFSLKNDYNEQISKFFTLSRERASDLSGKKYIDLRYGDKIFYY